jgi:hypothetical protein
VNDELETMWKDSVIVYFKVVLYNLPGGTEETHEKLRKAGFWIEI